MRKRLPACLLVFVCLSVSGSIDPSSSFSKDPVKDESRFVDESIPSWDEKYRSEPVVRLLEERSLQLNDDYSSVEDTYIVIKIQNEEGKAAGDVTVSYNRENDTIEYLKAYTITPEGKRIECTQIDDRNAYEGVESISENRFRLLTMPQVSAGCLLEIRHRIVHKRSLIANNFFQTVPVSAFYPVKVVRYKLTAPDSIKLNFKNQNTDIQPIVDRSDNRVIYHWEVKGKDAELVEDNMPSLGEICQVVSFTSLNDWSQLADFIWELFDKNLVVSTVMKAKVEEITEKDKSVKEKIQSVIRCIQDEYRYVSMSIDSHLYEPHAASEVFNNKYGDCKDQTVLAMAMLAEIGVKAYPALFSYTFDPDFEKRLPMPIYFNHVILCIEYEGARYYTDPLVKGFYFDETSYALSGGYVLVLNGKGGFIERVPAAKPYEYINSIEYKVEIGDDGSALFDGVITIPRIQSTNMRSAYLNATAEGRTRMLSSLDASLSSGGEMLEKTLDNMDDPYSNIKIKARYQRSDFVKKANDMMMFGIGRLNTLSLASVKRMHPIIFSGGNRTESKMDFIIPEGFEVLNLPKDISLNTEFALFSRIYQTDGRTIKVSDIYEIKMSRLQPSTYEDVRKFFNDVSSSTDDTIIIKKPAPSSN